MNIETLSRQIQTENGTLLVNASAGSGKTYQLTQRFLHLLSNTETQVHEILALTFTDAAAGEMRERIFSALNPETFQKMDSGMAERMEQHRVRFPSNHISTIHSFCQRLLRENPDALASIQVLKDPFDPDSPTAALEKGFVLIDPYTEKTERIRWRAGFFDKYADDAALIDWLRMESPKDLLQLLDFQVRIADEVLQRQASIKLDEWQELIHRFLSSELERFGDLLADFIGETSAHTFLFSAPPSPTLEWALSVCGEKQINRQKVRKTERESVPESLDNASVELNALRKNLESITGADITLLNADSIQSFVNEIAEQSASEHARREFLAWQYHTAMAKTGARWKAWTRFERFSNGLIDHDDSIWLARQLLDRNPEIVNRYRSRFKHIMVDEFQDTDRDQWRIVKHLSVIDSVHHSLFLVGDLKQAIYGFRGGEVSVMKRIPEEIAGVKSLPLPVTFRSNNTIVELVNEIFSQVMKRPSDAKSFEAAYETTRLPDEHKRAHQQVQGAVRMLNLSGPDWLQGLPPELAGRVEQFSPETWEAARAAHFLAWLRDAEQPVAGWERIQTLLKTGQPAAGILLRNNTNTERWANTFRAFGFKTSVASGGRFFTRQELIDLQFLLAFLADREDLFSLTGLLRSPWVNLSDAGLVHIKWLVDQHPAAAHRNSFWTILEEKSWKNAPLAQIDADALEIAVPWMKEASFAVRTEPVSAVVATLLSSIPAYEGYENPKTALAVLNRALNLIHEQELNGRSEISELAGFFRINRESEQNEKETPVDERAEVTILSIHKSKGLEFPLVILGEPAASGNPRLSLQQTPVDHPLALGKEEIRLLVRPIPDPERDEPYKPVLFHQLKPLNDARTEAETIRLFYVAVTRAETHFIFTNHENWKRNASSGFLKFWNGLQAEIAVRFSLQPHDAEVRGDYLRAGYVPLDIEEISDILPVLERENAFEDLPFDKEIAAAVQKNREKLREAASDFYRKPAKITSLLGQKQIIEYDATDDQAPDEARIRGTLVHKLIEWALNGHPLTVETASKALLLATSPEIPAHDAIRQATNAISAIKLRFPQARRFVTEHSFQTIIPSLNHLANGIADLLVEDSSGAWWLVDYKTSAWTEDFKAKAGEAGYFKQLQLYAEAYQELAGISIPPERQLLLLTAPASPVWINDR